MVPGSDSRSLGWYQVSKLGKPIYFAVGGRVCPCQGQGLRAVQCKLEEIFIELYTLGKRINTRKMDIMS